MTSARRRLTQAVVVSGIVLTGVLLALKLAERVGLIAPAAFQPAQLLGRFPAEQAVVFSADFSLLRAAGMFGTPRAGLEPEYQQFVEGTGFDYRRDLDNVLASVSATGNYFIARGRFNWPKLREYASRQGGSCYEKLCRMPGSRPERRISFLPLGDDLIAIAVATDDLAVTRLTYSGRRSGDGQPVTTQLPSAPAWLSVPGAALRQPGVMPAGLRVVLSGLANADRVIVTAAPGQGGAEIHLDAICRNPEEAGVLASQLRSATALLKEGMDKDPQLSADSLAVMLKSGSFDQKGVRVEGRWPLAKDVIENLTAGI